MDGTEGRPEQPSPPGDPRPWSAGGTPPRGFAPWGKLTFLIPIAILAFILSVVRIPYFVVQPGLAEDVEPLIQVQDHQTFPAHGHLLLTAVTFYQPNVYQALWAWIDKTEAVLPERDILAPGETQQQESTRALSEMDMSKIDAAVVALTNYAGYPDKHGSGVLVEQVAPGTPADGKLFAGDLIESVDGTPIADPDQLGAMIRAAGVGHPLAFHITAGGQTHDVTIAPAMFKGVDHPIIGIASVANFPFPLTIRSGDIGGPSAGLMWTLGLVDILTPGELTGGKTIAGTGTIALDGTVGPIGGIQQKVVAAERAGATVFFAPASEAADARAVAGHIVIVPVKTYLDAVRYLEAHP